LTGSAVQGGPITTVTLDALGRIWSTTKEGSPPAYHTREAGSGASCSPDDATRCLLAVTALRTVQAGSPQRLDQFDLRGRLILSEVAAFDPAHPLETFSDSATWAAARRIASSQVVYNERGLRQAEAAPGLTSQTAYWTRLSRFDALGRPGRKVVERDASLFTTAQGNGLAITGTCQRE